MQIGFFLKKKISIRVVLFYFQGRGECGLFFFWKVRFLMGEVGGFFFSKNEYCCCFFFFRWGTGWGRVFFFFCFLFLFSCLGVVFFFNMGGVGFFFFKFGEWVGVALIACIWIWQETENGFMIFFLFIYVN